MTYNDLVVGEIFVHPFQFGVSLQKCRGVIFKWNGDGEIKSHMIAADGNYKISSFGTGELSKATPEEQIWLEECIKAGCSLTLEQALNNRIANYQIF